MLKNKLYIILLSFVTIFLISGCLGKKEEVKPTNFEGLQVDISGAKAIGIGKEGKIAFQDNDFSLIKKVKAASNHYSLVKVLNDNRIEEVPFLDSEGNKVAVTDVPIIVKNYGEYTGVLYICDFEFNNGYFPGEVNKLINQEISQDDLLRATMLLEESISYPIGRRRYIDDDIIIKTIFIHNETGKVFDLNTLLFEGLSSDINQLFIKDLIVTDKTITVSVYKESSNDNMIFTYSFDSNQNKMVKTSFNPTLSQKVFNIIYHVQYGNTLYTDGPKFRLLLPDATFNDFDDMYTVTNTFPFRINNVLYLLSNNGQEIDLLKINEAGYVENLVTYNIERLYSGIDLINFKDHFSKMFFLPNEGLISDMHSYTYEYLDNYLPVLNDNKISLLPHNRINTVSDGNILTFDLETNSLYISKFDYDRLVRVDNQYFIFDIEDQGCISTIDIDTFESNILYENIKIQEESIQYDKGILSLNTIGEDFSKTPLFINVETGEIYFGEENEPAVEFFMVEPLN